VYGFIFNYGTSVSVDNLHSPMTKTVTYVSYSYSYGIYKPKLQELSQTTKKHKDLIITKTKWYGCLLQHQSGNISNIKLQILMLQGTLYLANHCSIQFTKTIAVALEVVGKASRQTKQQQKTCDNQRI